MMLRLSLIVAVQCSLLILASSLWPEVKHAETRSSHTEFLCRPNLKNNCSDNSERQTNFLPRFRSNQRPGVDRASRFGRANQESGAQIVSIPGRRARRNGAASQDKTSILPRSKLPKPRWLRKKGELIRPSQSSKEVPCVDSCRDHVGRLTYKDYGGTGGERPSYDDAGQRFSDFERNRRENDELDIREKIKKILIKKPVIDSGLTADGRHRMIHYTFDPNKRGPGNCINNCVGRGITFVRCKIICI